jgi:hypothetical protein
MAENRSPAESASVHLTSSSSIEARYHGAVSVMAHTPFESIESAQHFVALLAEAIADARQEIREDTETATAASAVRQVEALRLVDHKLSQLAAHLHASSKILNDLRKLRRLLIGQEE